MGSLCYGLASPSVARQLLESVSNGAASQCVDMMFLSLLQTPRHYHHLRVVVAEQQVVTGTRSRWKSSWRTAMNGGTLKFLPNASLAQLLIVIAIVLLVWVGVRVYHHQSTRKSGKNK